MSDTRLEEAFKKVLENSIVTPSEFDGVVKPELIAALDSKERQSEVAQALHHFLDQRADVLPPPVLREMTNVLRQKKFESDLLPILELISSAHALVASLLLTLAEDGDGLTANEWRPFFNDGVTGPPADLPLVALWSSLGAGPVNLFLSYAIQQRLWIAPEVLKEMNDPTEERATELSKFGVSKKLVAEYRDLNVPPPERRVETEPKRRKKREEGAKEGEFE